MWQKRLPERFPELSRQFFPKEISKNENQQYIENSQSENKGGQVYEFSAIFPQIRPNWRKPAN